MKHNHLNTRHAGDTMQRMQPIATEFCFTARAELAATKTLGDMSRGIRCFVPILGGTVQGPRLSGSIVAGGGDWQVIVSSRRIEVEARYFIRTDDDVLIAVFNSGLRRAEPDVMRRLADGEAVPADQYYFRTLPRFEAPVDSPHAWLNESLFVATAERENAAAVVHFHRIM
jgi:Protein of unknown function (DUF3237)